MRSYIWFFWSIPLLLVSCGSDKKVEDLGDAISKQLFCVHKLQSANRSFGVFHITKFVDSLGDSCLNEEIASLTESNLCKRKLCADTRDLVAYNSRVSSCAPSSNISESCLAAVKRATEKNWER